MGCGCQTCFTNPCCCPPVANCSQFCTSLTVTNSWNIPACAASAVLFIPGLTSVMIGSFLVNNTYGYFQITGFNSLNNQVTVINNCYVENAAPGTIVPANTPFILSSTSGTSVAQTWVPVVTGNGAMTVSALTVDVAEYVTVGILEFFNLGLRFTLGGVANSNVGITLPTTALNFNAGGFVNYTCAAQHAGAVMTNGALWRVGAGSPGNIVVSNSAPANWSLGAALIDIQGFYRRA